MAGTIIGAQGFQRSGKTFLMYSIAQNLAKNFGLKVYANIIVDDPNWIFINSLNDFPFNFEPKVLFIDEIYNGADANDWKKLKDISIFINTIGKQNVVFLFTTIDFGMVFNRIRNQMKYSIFVKSDSKHIYYRSIDVEQLTQNDFTLKKCPDLYKDSKYDHEFVPLEFDWSMDKFKDKVVMYYKDKYPQLLKYID